MPAGDTNSSFSLVQKCGAKPPPLRPDATCEEIRAMMNWVKCDIAQRVGEQLNGSPEGVAYPKGTIIYGRDVSGEDIWKNHDEHIGAQKRRLAKLKRKYQESSKPGGRCDDPPDDPGLESVDDVVNSKNPTMEDWKKHNNLTVDEWIKQHPGTVKTAEIVGAGYIGYRVLRFLPSLIPELWWTIPENLEVP